MAIVDVLRWMHVIGAAVLLGTGTGIAFFMMMAHRTRDPRLIAHVAGTVVIADMLFTATAVIAQIFVVAYAGAVSGTRETLDVALFTVVPVALVGGLLAGVIVPMPRRRKSRHESS